MLIPKKGISAELELEQRLQKTFDKLAGSFLCPYDISKIEEKHRNQWIKELRENHHAEIYISKSGHGRVLI